MHPTHSAKHRFKLNCGCRPGPAKTHVAAMQAAFANAEEDFAAHFLRLTGFAVLSRNERRHGAEVDLLCAQKSGGDIFICEVKRRSGVAANFYPVVSARQRSRLRKVALRMQQDANKFLTIRICLLLVDLRRGSVELVLDI